MTMVATLTYLHFTVASRLDRVHQDHRGEVTEKVIITAIFAALAIAAGAIIVAKVMARANNVPTQ